METKKKVLMALTSVVFAIITVIAIILCQNYLNFEISQNGSIKNLAQILVFAFGIFWIFAWWPYSVKQNIYFVIGVALILVSFAFFINESFYNLTFIEQSYLSEYSMTDALVLCFSGLYFMLHSYLKVPDKIYT